MQKGRGEGLERGRRKWAGQGGSKEGRRGQREWEEMERGERGEEEREGGQEMKEDKRGQRFEGVAHERGGREAESHNEGQRLIRGKGVEGRGGGAEGWRGGGEPTGEGRRWEPVERRQPGAGVPEALQLGVVRCPPPPRGSQQGGGQAGKEGRGKGTTPGKEGTTPTAQGTRDTRHMENARDKPSNRRNKTKTKRKSRLVGVLSLGAGHTLERGWGGAAVRQEERVRPGSCFPRGRGASCCPAGRHTSLFSHPSMGQAGAGQGPGDGFPLAHNSLAPTVSMAPTWDLSSLMVTCLLLDSAVTPPA